MAESQKPMYLKIKEEIYRSIASGNWLPGERLCSEDELAKKHQVSRMTARHALTEMEREGILVRYRGLGTFVAENKKHGHFGAFTTFRETKVDKGLLTVSKIIDSSIRPAGAVLAKMLKVQSSELIIRTQRLYLADQSPIAVLELHIINQFCPEVTAAAIEKDYPDFLKGFGVIIDHADVSIDVVTANIEQAKLLDVSLDFPLMRVRRFDFDREGRLMSYSLTYLRSDKYAYEATIIRRDK